MCFSVYEHKFKSFEFHEAIGISGSPAIDMFFSMVFSVQMVLEDLRDAPSKKWIWRRMLLFC